MRSREADEAVAGIIAELDAMEVNDNWQFVLRCFPSWAWAIPPSAPVTPPRKRARRAGHSFSLDDRKEFDEVAVRNASVQIERMDEQAYWIGIQCKGKPSLMVNTGLQNGIWFFNVEEDSVDGKRFEVQREIGPRRQGRGR